MRMPESRPVRILLNFVICIVLAGLLVPVGQWGGQIQYWRVEQGVAQESMASSIKDIPVEELTGIVVGALFAGFRSQAANFCWWKSQQYWEEEGHWPRVLPMMKAACALDPYFPEFWEVTGWHEAYNLAAEYETRDLPIRKYVEMGLTTLAKGLKFNPDAVQLYEQTGWTYRDKFGDLETALEYARRAIAAFHVRAEVTKQTEVIQPRFAAHQLEGLGRQSDALLQYGEVLIDRPYDNVGIGASLTIRDRYLAAERAIAAGKIAEAETLLRQHLADDPTDTLGLHMLARCRATAKDQWGALAAWEAAASLWADAHAQRNYVQLLEDTRRKELQLCPAGSGSAMWVDVLLMSKRVADFCVQPRQLQDGTVITSGLGVTLRLRKGGAQELSLLRPNERLDVGDVIVAEPYALPTSSVDPNRLPVIFYLHGREVARDDTAPYSFTITEKMLPAGAGESGMFVKAEMFVRGELVPRFDLREIKPPSPTIATAEAAGASPPQSPPPGTMGRPAPPPTEEPAGQDEHAGHDHG